ncbi:MAG: replicative DNA helicase [Bryobacterales bacterium]|jgi:replicative DNA helicase|nr:replicative DNA helicase [Bryobacterales bacterium]
MTSAITPLETGLPANLDAERYILGSILADDSHFVQVGGRLLPEDFSLEAHRRIFRSMLDLQGRAEKIDRVTVANELMRHAQLESCGGVAYLVSLDDGMPLILNLDGYIRIVRDKATLRRLIAVSQHLMSRCLSGAEDPSQILAATEDTLLKLGDAQEQRTAIMTPAQILDNYEGGLNAFLDPSKRLRGVSTGFAKLDEMTGGFRPGELIVLAARPSMGKTAFALNIAHHVGVKLRQPVVVFSLEMSKESLLTRMVCASARVDSHRFNAGYLNRDERERLQMGLLELTEAPIYFDDTAGINLMDMHSKLRRIQSEQPVGMVIVDYLQLMSQPGRTENRNQEISAISRGMKLLAKEVHAPIIALSQLSRAPETRQGDHRPVLSDLRESGSIEQDADLVGFIFREEVYKRDREDLRGLAELLIAKQRNGPIGKVDLVFLHSLTKFENRAEDLGDVG